MSDSVRAVFQLVQRAKAVAGPALPTVQAGLDRHEAVEKAALQAARPAITNNLVNDAAAKAWAQRQATDALVEESLAITGRIGDLLRARENKKRSFLGRWARSPDMDAEIDRLRAERTVVEARRSSAARLALKADVAEANARSAHKGDVADASADHAAASRLSELRLAIVRRARRLLAEWPTLAYCGLQRVLTMAWRAEKLRENGWDPGPQKNDLGMR